MRPQPAWTEVEVTTPPAALVAAADLRAHLRIDTTAEDDLLDDLIVAATGVIDGPAGIGVAMMQQSWTLRTRWFRDGMILPGWPVTAITQVTYLDRDEAEQTLSSDVYALMAGSDPARLHLQPQQQFPATADRPDAVRVVYVLGHASADDVPAPLVQAVKLLAGYYYVNRDMVAADGKAADLPFGVDFLIRRYRRGFIV